MAGRSERRGGRLYAAHADKLRRVVGGAIRTSESNVEDACSFAWLQLLCHRPRRESVFAWLATVATREAWRLHAQCGRDTPGGDLAAPTDAHRHTAHRDGIDRDELLDTLAALERLHPRRREMLLLQVAGFSATEIAARDGITAARARELIYKARLHLANRRRA